MTSQRETSLKDHDALLCAVAREVRAQVKRSAVGPVNGDGEMVWPQIAEVMTRLTGLTLARKQVSDRCRRLRRAGADLDALADQVAPEEYREVVCDVLGAFSRTPSSHDKQPAIPPSRSDNPDERVQARKEKIYQDHDRRVADQLVHQRALTELLVEAVERGAKEAPPIKIRVAPTVIVRDEAEEIPNALLGDVHGGALVDPEETGGLGQFDIAILKRRLANYQDRIVQTIDLQRRQARIRRMVIWMLGDMIEGEVIFDGQAYRIEMITTDQVFEVASYLIGWLSGILASGLVETIDVIGIPGNHGRITHRKGASKFHANWDYVLYRHMATALRNEPRIKWFIPKTWFAVVEMLGWRVYGSHGDVIKSWMGVPFYGIQRHDMRTTTLLQSVGLDYQYWVAGHFHISGTIPRVVGSQILNGSIVGGSDFSMHLLGTSSQPQQTMFGLHEKHGKTWQYDFTLDERNPEEIRKHLAYLQL